MKRIATHRRPDADALASAWLAQRFLFDGEQSEVMFVPREYVPPTVPRLDCVVDVGRAHDPARLLFAHKPPAFADRDSTCATRLLWRHLLSLGRPVAHLVELVDAVHDGDAVSRRSKSPAYARSRESGLHALIAEARKAAMPDAELLAKASGWLDGHETGLRAGTEPPGGREAVADGLPDEPGTYVLLLHAPRAAVVAVGRTARLARLELPAGRYAYVGSAMGSGGLRGRIKHHLTPASRLRARWDIDFVRLICAVDEVWHATGTADRECRWAEELASMPGASRAVAGFGAADCGCGGHLVRFDGRPSTRAFLASHGARGHVVGCATTNGVAI